MDAGEDPYKILGVAQDASNDDIKKVYRKLVLEVHPDKRPDAEKEQAQKEFQRLQRAFELLTDDAARKAFDDVLSATSKRKVYKSGRDREMQEKRRKMADSLEERERAAAERAAGAQDESDVDKARDRLKKELERLRKAREEAQLAQRMAAHDQILKEDAVGPAIRNLMNPAPKGPVSTSSVKKKQEDVFAKMRAKIAASKANGGQPAAATKRLHSET